MTQKKKYKRSILLINPAFQLKMVLMIALLVLICTIFYPISIYELFEQMLALNPERSEILEIARENLYIALAIIQLGIIGLVSVSVIFISHKIAGPMFKLKRHLQTLRQTGEVKELYFRKGDYFTDIADEVNQTLEYIQNKKNEDFAYIDEVKSYLENLKLIIPEDKKDVLEEIQNKLTKIQNNF